MAEGLSAWGPEHSPGRMAEQDLMGNQLLLGQIASQGPALRSAEAKAQTDEMMLAARRAAMARRAAGQTMAAPTGQLGATAAGAQVDPLQSLYGEMLDEAKLQTDMGFPEKGAQIMQRATGAMAHQAAQQAATARQRASQLLEGGRMADLIGRYINPDIVVDEDGWQQAVQQIESRVGRPVPELRVPYNAENVGRLYMGAQSVKDRVHSELLTDEYASRDRAREVRETTERARLPLIRAQTDLARKRVENVGKGGGSNKLPNANEIRTIVDRLTEDYMITSDEETRNIAREIVEQAKGLLGGHQGLSASEAYTQAYAKAKASGRITMRPRTVGGKRYATPPLPKGFVIEAPASEKDSENDDEED